MDMTTLNDTECHVAGVDTGGSYTRLVAADSMMGETRGEFSLDKADRDVGVGETSGVRVDNTW